VLFVFVYAFTINFRLLLQKHKQLLLQSNSALYI